jgi:serine/threonine protein kinase
MTGGRWISDSALDRLREVAERPDLNATAYTIVGTLGRGGMGTVYLAHDGALDREVALKVVDGEAGGELSDRTLREARILARLEHPGIVPVHDVGRLPDGRVFYAMKRVRGERLDALAPALDLGESLRVVDRICEAVAFAHAHGLIHRDLKPENVMVGPFGEVLVMDWGVAKDLNRSLFEGEGSAADGTGTAHGAIVGTPGYMAPEQERGELEEIGAQTDVWALGAILSFLLAGEDPIPRPLQAIRDRAMAHAPADRYPRVEDLAGDLALYRAGLAVGAYRESLVERAGRFVRRYRLPILVILTYILVRVLLVFLLRR